MEIPKIEALKKLASEHSVAFFAGVGLSGGLTAAYYKFERIPALKDQVEAATQLGRVAVEKEELKALKSSSFASSPATGGSGVPSRTSIACAWTPAAHGTFTTGGDHKAAGWKADDGDAADRVDSKGTHTQFVSIISDRIVRGANGAPKWEKLVGGIKRNPQFPRIELAVPQDWFGREVKMQATMRWQGIKDIPEGEPGYPGVVAVNLAYRDEATPVVDQFVLLHAEHIEDMAWETFKFPTFRLPPGTASAKVRIGLHGVYGTLHIANASFSVCR